MQRHRVTIVVPERALSVTGNVAHNWTMLFGGATVTRAQGWWHSEGKGAVIETVDRVEVLVPDGQLPQAVESAESWALTIKNLYGEEAVLMTVEREVAYKLA